MQRPHSFVGSIVLYALTAADAKKINSLRSDAKSRQQADGPEGNPVCEGTLCPALVVMAGDTVVNLRVFTDGSDTPLWVGSTWGHEPGCWQLILEGDGDEETPPSTSTTVDHGGHGNGGQSQAKDSDGGADDGEKHVERGASKSKGKKHK